MTIRIRSSDPAIVRPSTVTASAHRLGGPENEAWDAFGGSAARRATQLGDSLWRASTTQLGPVKKARSNSEAVKIGWLERMPGPSIGRMVGIGVAIALIGGGTMFAGIASR